MKAQPGVAHEAEAAEPTSQPDLERRLIDSSRLAYRVAYAVLRQREDAEEVVQEAFLRAYRGYGRLRDRERFRAWLVRITWRLSQNQRRANARRRRREEAAALAGAISSASVADHEQDLARTVDALPERLRLVVVLYAVEGRAVREVARLLGVPEGTVKSRLHVARKRLLEALQ